jgi:hypothetical protein
MSLSNGYLTYLGSKKCCDLRGLGPTGATGGEGAMGPQGSPGAIGPTGPAGPAGPLGVGGYGSISSTATISTTTPFSIPIGGTMSPGKIYAVQISVYISGSVSLSNLYISFNFTDSPSILTYYPSTFTYTSTATTPTPFYLTSVNSGLIYTGTVTDFFLYNGPSNITNHFVNVYVNPASVSPNTYSVKMTATVTPVN